MAVNNIQSAIKQLTERLEGGGGEPSAQATRPAAGAATEADITADADSINAMFKENSVSVVV